MGVGMWVDAERSGPEQGSAVGSGGGCRSRDRERERDWSREQGRRETGIFVMCNFLKKNVGVLSKTGG